MTSPERVCDNCGTPESEEPHEYRGHGDGWLLCVEGCADRHTCHRREYAELTTALLDELEAAADRAQRDFEPLPLVVEVDAAVLHALVRAARITVARKRRAMKRASRRQRRRNKGKTRRVRVSAEEE